jgi:cation-transporting ATPase E
MTGLTSAQVQERVRKGLVNTASEPVGKSVEEIIKSNIFTYFNLVFTVLAVLLMLVGSFRDLTFMGIVVINTLIGIVQEIRAKNTLEKLTLINTPKAVVLRDGIEKSISVEELVQDDIIIFSAGNQIPADAVVEQGEVHVNESLITGEADEIVKQAGDSLLSGSFIVSGRCYAKITKVGKESYAAQITAQAKAVKEEKPSEMIRSLDVLVKTIGIIIIPVGIAMYLRQHYDLVNPMGIGESVRATVAALIGMIPEGLYLLASVAMVVSVQRLAKKRTLVHEMACIETLSRVDVLCVDKTGTITETKMTVNGFLDALTYEESDDETIRLLLGDFMNQMEADNNTMEALKQYFQEHTSKEALSKTSFSSVHKYSSVAFEQDCSYVIGAPEFVLREDYQQVKEKIEPYSSKGYRILVFGRYDKVADGSALQGQVEPMAYILLSNPIRKEAKATFQYFAEQGVAIKVISGDNPVTVSQIAAEAGIVDADKYVDATTLDTDNKIQEAILKHTVFGRVTPDQKRAFVKALKSAGHTVAMTGDGVNDVLALKDADCSIAMASGSDAACQVAQLVLLDSNFASMPAVVAEGRRVVNNIERSASLFLVKNIFSFVLAILTIIIGFNYPIRPNQIALINMFTIGTPAFFLALQPNKAMVKGKFLPNVLLRAFPAALTDLLLVGVTIVLGNAFHLEMEQTSTIATYVMGIVGFVMLFRICQPWNGFRRLVWGAMVVGMVACMIIPFGRDWFGLETLHFSSAVLVALIGALSYPCMKGCYKIIAKIEAFVERCHERWLEYKLN